VSGVAGAVILPILIELKSQKYGENIHATTLFMCSLVLDNMMALGGHFVLINSIYRNCNSKI
jgi:hypothetical protein